MKKTFWLLALTVSVVTAAYADDPYALSASQAETASANSGNASSAPVPGAPAYAPSVPPAAVTSYGSSSTVVYSGTSSSGSAGNPVTSTGTAALENPVTYGNAPENSPAPELLDASAKLPQPDPYSAGSSTIPSTAGADAFVSGESSPAYTPPAPVEPSQPKVNMAEKRLERAKDFYAKSKLGKAYEILEDLQTDSRLSVSLQDEARKLYEEISMKLLFSKEETAESAIHTVVSGDVLYNIAKKYKTTVELIKRSNGLTKDLIHPGMKLKVIKGIFSVRVNKSRNDLQLVLDNKVLKTYRVATGEKGSTPSGDFKITAKQVDPTWYKKGEVIPAGSGKNQLGTRWLGFNKEGYGIHGTNEPEKIGEQTSSGCIRMRNEDAEELYDILPYSTRVTVID